VVDIGNGGALLAETVVSLLGVSVPVHMRVRKLGVVFCLLRVDFMLHKHTLCLVRVLQLFI